MRLLVVLSTLFACLLSASAAHSDELSELRARNARLEATVQELTLQLGDALREQQRLEAALAAASTSASLAPEVSADPVVESRIEDRGAMLTETAVTGTASVASQGAIPESADMAAGPCDVEEALRGYKGSSDNNKALGEWLKVPGRLDACSTPQLTQLRKAVDWDWMGFQKELIALLDKELATR